MMVEGNKLTNVILNKVVKFPIKWRTKRDLSLQMFSPKLKMPLCSSRSSFAVILGLREHCTYGNQSCTIEAERQIYHYLLRNESYNQVFQSLLLIVKLFAPQIIFNVCQIWLNCVFCDLFFSSPILCVFTSFAQSLLLQVVDVCEKDQTYKLGNTNTSNMGSCVGHLCTQYFHFAYSLKFVVSVCRVMSCHACAGMSTSVQHSLQGQTFNRT